MMVMASESRTLQKTKATGAWLEDFDLGLSGQTLKHELSACALYHFILYSSTPLINVDEPSDAAEPSVELYCARPRPAPPFAPAHQHTGHRRLGGRPQYGPSQPDSVSSLAIQAEKFLQ